MAEFLVNYISAFILMVRIIYILAFITSPILLFVNYFSFDLIDEKNEGFIWDMDLIWWIENDKGSLVLAFILFTLQEDLFIWGVRFILILIREFKKV